MLCEAASSESLLVAHSLLFKAQNSHLSSLIETQSDVLATAQGLLRRVDIRQYGLEDDTLSSDAA